MIIPTTCGHKDSDGYYCVWGTKGKHYYYKKGDKLSMARARVKANKQGAAAHASGYEGISKSSDIQSVRFRKDMFGKQQAVSWAKSHEFKYNDVEETQNQWRLRQFPPGKCIGSGGMKHLADGVSAYICPISETNKSYDDLLVSLNNISSLLDSLKPSGGTDEEPREDSPGSEILI